METSVANGHTHSWSAGDRETGVRDGHSHSIPENGGNGTRTGESNGHTHTL